MVDGTMSGWNRPQQWREFEPLGLQAGDVVDCSRGTPVSGNLITRHSSELTGARHTDGGENGTVTITLDGLRHNADAVTLPLYFPLLGLSFCWRSSGRPTAGDP